VLCPYWAFYADMLYPDTQQTMTTGIHKVYLFSFVFQITTTFAQVFLDMWLLVIYCCWHVHNV